MFVVAAGASALTSIEVVRRSIRKLRRGQQASQDLDSCARRSQAGAPNGDGATTAGQPQTDPPAPTGAGSEPASPLRTAPCAPPPQLRGGALVVFRDARGQGIVANPAAGHGDWWDLSATCASSGVLRLRVADLAFSCTESVFLVEEAPGGLLAFRSIGAHGLPLVASSPRDAPHRVGPCFSAGGSQVGPAALWRPSNVGLTNPKTGKRLGFAVVELFAVSSESLKRLERAAADQYGTALAQVATLQAQLAASEAKRQEQEQAAALEWRRMRQETSRLSEDLRRADEARREARVAAESAGLRVLQLEQRVGQLSADKQAADQACATSEGRAQGLAQRLAALEAAFQKERKSWAADTEGVLRAERAAQAEELAAARKSLAELQESIAARERETARKDAERKSLAKELVSRDDELRELAAANTRLDLAMQSLQRHMQRSGDGAERSSLSSISLGELRDAVAASGSRRRGVKPTAAASAADRLRLWQQLHGSATGPAAGSEADSDGDLSCGSDSGSARSGREAEGEPACSRSGGGGQQLEDAESAAAGVSARGGRDTGRGPSARSVDAPPQLKRSPVKGSPAKGSAASDQHTAVLAGAGRGAQQAGTGSVKAAAAAAIKRAAGDLREARDSAAAPRRDAAVKQAAPAVAAAGRGGAEARAPSAAPAWPSSEGCVLLRPRLGAAGPGSSAAAAAPAGKAVRGTGVAAGGPSGTSSSMDTAHSLSMRALGEAARSVGSGSMGRRSSEEAGSHRYSFGEASDLSDSSDGGAGRGAGAGMGRGADAASPAPNRPRPAAAGGATGGRGAYDWSQQQQQHEQLLLQLQQLDQQDGRGSAAPRQQHLAQQRLQRPRYAQHHGARASGSGAAASRHGAAAAPGLPPQAADEHRAAEATEGAVAASAAEQKARGMGAGGVLLAPVREEMDQASASLLASPSGWRSTAARSLRMRGPSSRAQPGANQQAPALPGGANRGGGGGGGAPVAFKMADAISLMGTADPHEAAALISCVAEPLVATRLMHNDV